MRRIDTPTKHVDKHGVGKHGFRNGDALNGVSATDLQAEIFDHVQEELCAVIEAAGLAVGGAALNQLLLALRAAGVFTTPAQFDKTTKAATTEFVRLALGNIRSVGAVIAANAVLTAADAGVMRPISGAFTVTLPAANSVPSGAAFKFQNTSVSQATIQTAGADTVSIGTSSRANSILFGGETVSLISDGVSKWYALEGSGLAQFTSAFGASFDTNGYQKLPSGLILQWGVGASATTDNAAQTIAFPIAFPTICFAVNVTGEIVSGGGINVFTSNGNPTTTSFVAYSNMSTPNGVITHRPHYLAIGK